MQKRSSDHAQGIDISHWQGTINWEQVRAAGKVFAFIKASEGSTVKDKQFLTNVQKATAAGLLVGAYHFSRATSPAGVKIEVDHFLSVVSPVTNDMKLPLVLDIETKEAGSKANIVKTVRAWVEYFKQRTGKYPMIYTFPNFIDTSLDASFGDIKLWYAYYNNDGTPINRGGWKDWEFLQYSSSGKVKGISGDVDMNEYHGSEKELRDKYDPTMVTPPPTEIDGKSPLWKETGRQWLIDELGISEDWKATDVVDIGTLGTILSRAMNNKG
ncbi:glycoside hydrolase family 25 protein [Paenibacillus sp. FA6]|uniref:glycoside hydrolase family 25 protein n=1 Tax=Paenibacillus sp. FA6 TaxID=3413029 RepID=UPI003F65A04E